MKNTLLCISIVINIALVTAWWIPSKKTDNADDLVLPASGAIKATQEIPPQIKTATSNILALNSNDGPALIENNSLESIGEIAARLQKIGVSKEIEYLMISALLEDMSPLRVSSDKVLALYDRVDLEEDKRNALLALYGQDVIDDSRFANLFKPLNDRLPFLASSQQIAIDLFMKEQQARMPDGIGDDDFFLKAKENQLLLEQHVATLLTEDEMLDYQLATSFRAQTMKLELSSFEPTQDELRALMSLSNQYETDPLVRQTEMLNDYFETGQINRENVANSGKIPDHELVAALGEERYQDYQRAKDPVFASLQKHSSTLGLSDDEIDSAYKIVSKYKNMIMSDFEQTKQGNGASAKRISDVQSSMLNELSLAVGEDAASELAGVADVTKFRKTQMRH